MESTPDSTPPDRARELARSWQALSLAALIGLVAVLFLMPDESAVEDAGRNERLEELQREFEAARAAERDRRRETFAVAKGRSSTESEPATLRGFEELLVLLRPGLAGLDVARLGVRYSTDDLDASKLAEVVRRSCITTDELELAIEEAGDVEDSFVATACLAMAWAEGEIDAAWARRRLDLDLPTLTDSGSTPNVLAATTIALGLRGDHLALRDALATRLADILEAGDGTDRTADSRAEQLAWLRRPLAGLLLELRESSEGPLPDGVRRLATTTEKGLLFVTANAWRVLARGGDDLDAVHVVDAAVARNGHAREGLVDSERPDLLRDLIVEGLEGVSVAYGGYLKRSALAGLLASEDPADFRFVAERVADYLPESNPRPRAEQLTMLVELVDDVSKRPATSFRFLEERGRILGCLEATIETIVGRAERSMMPRSQHTELMHRLARLERRSDVSVELVARVAALRARLGAAW